MMLTCQSASFIGRTRDFPREIFDQKVEIRRSMSGIRRTKVKTECRRRFTVTVIILSRAKYLELRSFILTYHGQNMGVTFMESQRQNNTGLPITQDFGGTIDQSLIAKMLTTPVTFSSYKESEVELEFEEVV